MSASITPRPSGWVLDDPARFAPPNDPLIVSSQLIDADGRVIPEQEVFFECGPNRVCGISQNDRNLRQVYYYYHPADRYWRFQWTESALLLAATLALGAVAVGRTARSRL
jgi:hypothetical protein